MEQEQVLMKKVEHYVTNLLTFHLPKNIYYHNIAHTRMVVGAVQIISKKTKLEKRQVMILELAAWFHDIGFLSKNVGHKRLSAEMAANFLKTNKVRSSIIYQVTDCIMSTKYGAVPESLAEAIIMDADMFHISRNDYWKLNSLLRKEISSIDSSHYTHEEWYGKNLEFLKNISFNTDFGKNVLDVKKRWLIYENEQLLEKIQKSKEHLWEEPPYLFSSRGIQGKIKMICGDIISL
ncbi:HD domain-containing protein [Flagellimonas sp. HMM57]|uniref:HD domain-containing protein n=1 Tax=unclassified Flagellimonas TaxID=2644544 RepID=UPI0013D05E66|nr:MULTISPECIES: HD domain-containing protein [unclassified Flagellimonas]UII77758.1 HD domain-containing protein [Flagellimonas sp. HMM57]